MELSWNERKGLEMYVDKELVASSASPTEHRPLSVTDHAVYIGRPTDDIHDGRYSDAIVDELEYWYADRDQLIVLGLLGEGQWRRDGGVRWGQLPPGAGGEGRRRAKRGNIFWAG